jgi:YesN/AraC family two-component response regulator
LKSHPATQDVPVLFYSLTQERDSGSLLEVDYLTKPLGRTELAQALARHGTFSVSPTEGGLPRTILIVDDDPGTLEIHSRIVQSQSSSYRVLQAHNGREALETLQETRADLVLLDLMMPELDGFGVLQAMREHEHTRSIPVIVLTAQVLSEADMARLNQGVAIVLEKGLFSVEETLAHVEAALARNRKLGSETQRLARKAMAYLHTHYPEPISRESVARYVGVSEDYLTRCFHQEVGVAPMAYLNRYRVNRAKALLEAARDSVEEIAVAVGFSDAHHFRRVFRREAGMSPSAYQRARTGRVG